MAASSCPGLLTQPLSVSVSESGAPGVGSPFRVYLELAGGDEWAVVATAPTTVAFSDGSDPNAAVVALKVFHASDLGTALATGIALGVF